jgi:outer membrane protein OmpA-like peptidoglycan-associated protein
VAPAPPPPAPPKETVSFDRESSRVNNIAKAQLDDIALKLREMPRATVIVTGYSDGRKGASAEKLAKQRAENVKRYLVDRHKIDAGRISVETDVETTGAQAVVTIVTPR